MGLQKDFVEVALSSDGDGCIVWPFTKGANGYGKIKLSYVSKDVHRYVCELAHGLAPDKNHAAHNCGNRLCINPRHLRWATAHDNMADMARHGTLPRGSKRAHAKLNEADVLEIRSLAGIVTQSDLASRYGVCRERINGIINRRLWIHI